MVGSVLSDVRDGAGVQTRAFYRAARCIPPTRPSSTLLLARKELGLLPAQLIDAVIHLDSTDIVPTARICISREKVTVALACGFVHVGARRLQNATGNGIIGEVGGILRRLFCSDRNREKGRSSVRRRETVHFAEGRRQTYRVRL